MQGVWIDGSAGKWRGRAARGEVEQKAGEKRGKKRLTRRCSQKGEKKKAERGRRKLMGE